MGREMQSCLLKRELVLLRVHTNDGITTRFDLEDKEQAAEWLEKIKDSNFQDTITGLTVSHRGVLYSFSKPQGFRNLSYQAEDVEVDLERKIKGGERVLCYADDVRISLMVHRSQRAVRVTLAKTGKRRFNPLLR